MTRRRLGGWLRLWIILGVVYGGVVATVTFMGMASNAPIQTYEAFIFEMSDESFKVLARATELIPGTRPPDAKLMFELLKPDSVEIKTPDGFGYVLPGNITIEEANRISAEYKVMMATQLAAIRWSRIRAAALWWLIPCLLALCAGLAIRWAYRGFGRV